MPNRSKSVLIWLVAACLSVLATQGYALELNGIAAYKHLRKEHYLAALYLASPSDDANTLLDSNGTQRMHIKVTIDKWSPRRWAYIWQDNIAINNDLSAKPELLDAIMAFTQFPKDALTEGDEITIDYNAALGTTIRLNNQLVVQTEGRELYRFMLSTWVGKLPPSNEFKQRILKRQQDETETALLTRFEQLQLPASRERVVANWIESDKQQAQALAAQKAKAAAAKQARAQAAEQAKADAIAQAAAKQEAAEQAARNAEQKRLQAERQKQEAERQKQLAIARAQREEERKQAKLLAQQQAKQQAAQNQQVLAQEQAYYFDLYQWELQRDAGSRVIYPAWAEKFGQQGSVSIEFNVNEQGEITQLTHKNEAISQLLKQEAERVLTESSRYIFPPVNLQGSSWTLKFDYDFNLNGKPQALAAKPKKPESLLPAKLNSQQSEALKQQYIAQALESVNVFIQYPESARVLRHRGEVIVEVTIDSNGQVIDIKDKQATRYSTLNQQLRSAIEMASPMQPIPDELRLDKLSFEIGHNYKN